MFRLVSKGCRRKGFWIPLFCLGVVIAKPLQAENILLISVDTLRADRLSCYGYKRNRTPNIDRWAAEGVIFQRAYTEFPLTLPAHSTILTGTYPVYHGIRENIGFVLNDDHRTLAELLRDKGYKTAAFIGAYVLASEFGISQGFDVFDEEFSVPIESVPAATSLQRPAEEVTGRFLTWLEKSQQPFFAFVHYFDPHIPRPNGYDWEVSQVDRSIGKIDDYLRNKGLLEKTHIILLSDHGESLGEHGEAGHGFFIYDSTLHVPLIIRPARSLPFSVNIISSAVSLADVMPTILQMVRVPLPAATQGRSLLRLMLGGELPDRGLYAETFVPQLHFGWSPLRSCRMGRYKFIDAPRPELYNVSVDPGEKVNLYSENVALANQHKTWMEEFSSKYQTRTDTDATSSVSSETRERLAALGYVGLSRQRAQATGTFGEGIDPKDRIGVFEACHKLINDIAAGEVSHSVFEEIARIRIRASEVEGLTYLEARAHDLLGAPEKAERKYRQALEENPEDTASRYYLARMLAARQRLTEAEQELLIILKNHPGDYRSRNNLAGIYRSTGRIDEAIDQMEAIVDQRPGYVTGWQNLGQLYLDVRDWKKAEEVFRKVTRLKNDNALAHFHLARVLRAVGRTAEAEEEMKLAISLDPRLARLENR